MRKTHLVACASLLCALAALACNPSERRPGLWLRGEVAETPEDWSFSDEFRDIAIEVRTPYFVPHSVTIWCAQQGGQLFVGARDPESKRWPGWVEDEPDVRLGIGDSIYEVRLERMREASAIEPVLDAYAAKYGLERENMDPAALRYWRVVPRSG